MGAGGAAGRLGPQRRGRHLLTCPLCAAHLPLPLAPLPQVTITTDTTADCTSSLLPITYPQVSGDVRGAPRPPAAARPPPPPPACFLALLAPASRERRSCCAALLATSALMRRTAAAVGACLQRCPRVPRVVAALPCSCVRRLAASPSWAANLLRTCVPLALLCRPPRHPGPVLSCLRPATPSSWAATWQLAPTSPPSSSP